MDDLINIHETQKHEQKLLDKGKVRSWELRTAFGNFALVFSSILHFILIHSKKNVILHHNKDKFFIKIGVWRSWLACLHGVQEVGSSSLLTPTKKNCSGN